MNAQTVDKKENTCRGGINRLRDVFYLPQERQTFAKGKCNSQFGRTCSTK